MPTLVVEASGQLASGVGVPVTPDDAEDLYSVFTARAELMGWSTTGARRRPRLWGMNDAALTVEADGSRIGWVQVGLGGGVEPVIALLPLIQCLHDALRRFGAVELSGLQVTGSELQSARSCTADLISGLNWFNAPPHAKSPAGIVIDDQSLEGRTDTELLASLQRLNTGGFEFGPQPTTLSVRQQARETPDGSIPTSDHSRLGLSVTLPESSATALAWALAIVVDATAASGPGLRSFTARVDVS